jgi:cytochrome oxidase Cu insertion factor (SCO1/SenC/PrrC family)
MGSGSVVLLPIYTRCSASCPLQTQKLKRALSGLGSAPVRVLVFSFDPAETVATIAEYRKRENIPANWRVIRADQSAVRGFFDFFHYSVFNEKGEMIHPDQIFLLDPSLRWQFTMAGLNWSPQELDEALEETRSPGIVMWARTHPDTLAWTGLFSIAFGVGLLCVWLVRRRPASPSVTTCA